MRLVVSSAALLFSVAFASERKKTALLVVGLDADQPLWADKVYKNRLEKAGFAVTVIRDKLVTGEACEAHDIMLVSASISGGVVGTKLNKCTTPQMIWESRTWQLNGMARTGSEASRITSDYFNKFHEDSWGPDDVPPPNTGPDVDITSEGAQSPLAAGLAGVASLWTVDGYGMNYVPASWLGKGAKVVANLPDSLKLKVPQDKHATLFYYEKGAKLFGTHGKSPALRIGWPAFGFNYGDVPSCAEAAGIPCTACHQNCQTVDELKNNGNAPTPLTFEGLCILDAAIEFMASKSQGGNQQQSTGLIERHSGGLPEGSDGAAFIQLPRTEM